ncbi:hypothetical protein DGG96_16610 [Legionella qingyii]|uniref:Uncharacterized protein n=1 Tax=Legionella qingyii TaxID=2184757 RepID=A0A317U126_9GAMM|nr:hypothetical protein [Legionella qingyii]PWY54507.1 hypothetical protein DGG96_16610 [Legionella qingyii]RUR19400.1 hypothetical protein ELY20_15810 [Legionella qingyii]RUR22920.1 hypothetical protein ELY16_14250 [Legionella qingyii]
MGTCVKNEENLTSDAIHNRNCYAYFVQLKTAIRHCQNVINLLPEFTKLQAVMKQKYDKDYPYGDLYSSCISALEKYIETNPAEKVKELDELVLAIYHNDNKILEESSDWINDIGAQINPRKRNVEKKIHTTIKDKKKTVNRHSPNNEGGIYRRLYSLFADNFKPQHETNLPTIKNFSHKEDSDASEHRFSTQAQRHNGQTRISPLFKRWLQINAESSEKSICHIYFNNLGLDRSKYDIAGSKERDMTLELHKLEDDPSLKVLVITLPANEGLMESSDYEKTNDRLSFVSVFDEFLDIASENTTKNVISDFHISAKARNFLFDGNQYQILTQLLQKSFLAQGLSNRRFISSAEKQAVWVHFIKYELPNYIIQKVNPKSFNFSCKDAIDRGALSSTYYNLVRSFELEKPITKREFERSLDAPAANVKGRGMNFHRKIIWNAINTYVNANYLELINNKKKSWLIHWRDMNCPGIQTKQILNKRLSQTIEQFNKLPEEHGNIKKTGLKLLNTVTKLDQQKSCSDELLLEIISRTSELVNSSSEESIRNYEVLTDEVQINYPSLYELSGMMVALLGFILYIPSCGYSQALIDYGVSFQNKGFFYEDRIKLSEEIAEFTTALQ